MKAQKRTTKNNMPMIRERNIGPIAAKLGARTLGMQPNSKYYKMGVCNIIISPPTDGAGWHLSISSTKRYPTWDEIAHARYELLPDDALMMMELPPKGEYINIHENTFHLHENVPFEQVQSITKILMLFDTFIMQWIDGDESALDKLRQLHSEVSFQYRYNADGEIVDGDGNLL